MANNKIQWEEWERWEEWVEWEIVKCKMSSGTSKIGYKNTMDTDQILWKIEECLETALNTLVDTVLLVEVHGDWSNLFI